ncbi:hypothetical protein XcuCFBP2542_18605 [Xanthomonas cucurbitae]|uniref:DUF4189 domain-containing protein n=1 Tax=Xanthomonas cucurbitae TaxID=56453 RepID=A0A2S7D9Q7_9XANT|nr:DUF4189 domain-containing protein [Xanthomonas cucurbitae]PPU70537.1 hypothetical protein XcuCFBP2542_18605 [Xanthomonas cucurbitae]WDM80517.1 DUF4189 domain-containing protein [Xanthomonas cucurbitae]WDM84207.1 DUF4189 domain-containing protein [Xanthomonas cucurbitae]
MNRLFLLVFINTLSINVVFGQTACPSGVAPGSPQCGPDSGTSRGDIPTPAPRPTGEWIKTWGAIAHSNSTGEAGSAVGKLSESEAKDVAIRQCAIGGANDCSVKLVYKNQCAALVASKSQSFFESSASEEESISSGLDACKKSKVGGCRVVYSECSEPIFKRY